MNVVVTRDINDDVVEIWSETAKVYREQGVYFENSLSPIVVFGIGAFKRLFGFTPRKGSKAMYELQIGEVKR